MIENIQTRAWNAAKSGQYEVALHLFSEGYELNDDLTMLYGRAKTYLLAGKADLALIDFQKLIYRTSSKLQSAGNFAYLGICYWYLGQPEKAIETWRSGLKAPYADAAGGVLLPELLLYAGARLNHPQLEEEALELLERKWQKHLRDQKKDSTQDFSQQGLVGWPGAVVPYLLQFLSTEELIETATSTKSETLNQRQVCQAEFSAAVQAMRSDNFELFRKNMDSCGSNPYGFLEAEYFVARWEQDVKYPTVPFQ